MKNINSDNLGDHLLKSIPEFKDSYNEYLKDQNGENLPHVLFGDFTRFVVDQFTISEDSPKAKDIFLRCLNFVEEILLTNDADLRNVVGASFLENLHEPDDYYGLIKSMKLYFKPKTLELLQSMER